ncbi:hypothetical protein A2T98_01405 [Nodularia spumigena CENA596]|uniref:Uncharacterized protein n=1 Tax=Nodularia spumigena CENA596 TaxID=1819295 RepID=A0A161VVW2_NODSP|nr:hypothetical protein [Nodularia spumigena]KZL51545.1 hypothetical protein A2T98_01405 [Nodularia spumigena CENA596]
MYPETVEIHEFSTGIRPERTADGGWVSLGFTGQYMNVTLKGIPEVVERSIANREFAVTEGASTEQPAIIGRVVGTGDNTWAVVAVVTRGRDEKGRSVSVYRYFLAQGENNLRKILAWWEDQGRPKFNPFDIKTVGQYESVDPTSFHQSKFDEEAKNLPIETTEPILLQPQQYSLETINILAFRKFNILNKIQPVSWASDVEALEKPRSFQIIQPASTRAYEILQRAIKQTPQVSTPVVGDEEALKSAIRSLMNSSQVKPDAVKVIKEALGDKQITSEYWHTLFDGQGAKTAINQKIYSSQMVRLITLRAMVIPKTIPEFLTWLNVKAGKNPDENETISLNFQSAVGKQFPKYQLTEGIKLLLPKLLQGDITPELFHWLFIKGRAWDVCRSEFINDVRYDLQLIYKHFNSGQQTHTFSFDALKFQKVTWQKIIGSWRAINGGYYQLDDYLPLAQLFEQLHEYDLSAYFYQVSERKVPKDVFLAASPNPSNRPYSLTFLGLTLERDVTLIEGVINYFLQEYIVPIKFVIILSLILSGTSFVIGSQFFSKSQTPPSTSPNPAGQKVVEEPSVFQMPEDKRNIILIANTETNFNTTKTALNKLTEEQNPAERIINRQKMIEKMKAILDVEFDFSLMSKSDSDNITEKQKSQQMFERIKLSEAIYSYQKRNNIQNVTGYIKDGDQTYNSLRREINNN